MFDSNDMEGTGFYLPAAIDTEAAGEGFRLLPDMCLFHTVKGQYITVYLLDSLIDLQIFFVGFPEWVIHFKDALDSFFPKKLLQLPFCRTAYILTAVNNF